MCLKESVRQFSQAGREEEEDVLRVIRTAERSDWVWYLDSMAGGRRWWRR